MQTKIKCENRFQTRLTLKYHKSTITSKYPCDLCEFTAITFKKILDPRKRSTMKSSYLVDIANLKEHMMTSHADSAILTTISSQQLMLFEEMSTFKQEMGSLVYHLIDGQNQMRSEILLLKEDLAKYQKEEAKKKEDI